MAKSDNFFSKFRLVKVRSRKLTIIMLAVAIVLSMGALAALHLSMISLKNKTEDLRKQAIHLEAENQELKEDIEEVDSIHGIVEIAEEQLGLVQPDTIIFQTEP